MLFYEIHNSYFPTQTAYEKAFEGVWDFRSIKVEGF